MTRSSDQDRLTLRSHTRCVVLLAASFLVGCGGRELIPTPNLYVLSEEDPYVDTPEVFRTNEVDVLYVTDRNPVKEKDGSLAYGHGRSKSMAFGSAVVRFGDEDVEWSDLVAASRTHDREVDLPVELVRVEERHRFPPTPYPLVDAASQDQSPDGRSPDGFEHDPAVVARYEEAAEKLRAEVRERLAKTPRKHAYVFVHGSYFYSHPAVLSDVILILRDGRLPGAEHGRPLEQGDDRMFWQIGDEYPGD